MYWPPLLEMEIVTPSLPYHETGRQRGANDFWPFIMGNRSMMHQPLSIYDVLTVFLAQNAHEELVAAVEPKLVGTVRETVAGMSLGHLPRAGANSTLIRVRDQGPLRLPIMRDLESLTLS